MPADALFKIVNAVHRPLFRLTKGKVGGKGLGMPVLVLTTTGAKSGAKRSVMLTSPLQLGESYVLVASRGGDDQNPAWLHNLRAHPAVEIELDGRTRPMTARVAAPPARPRGREGARRPPPADDGPRRGHRGAGRSVAPHRRRPLQLRLVPVED